MNTPRPTVTIVVVDDHPVVRDGVRSMLAGVTGFEWEHVIHEVW